MNNDRNVSRGVYWLSWVLSIIPCLLLLFSASMKFFPPEGFQEGLDHMGWPAGLMRYLGVVEVLSTLLYLFPRTSVLGAVLLTGYMGGAIATHVRIGDPFLIQLAIGVIAWFALWLREPRLKALLPIRI